MADCRRSGENELSRLFALGDLDRHGATIEISAADHELAVLAGRFGLVAVDFLAATITLKRDETDHLVHLRGNITADVVQSCVITLEPVANHIEGAVDVAYSVEEGGAWAVRDMAPHADIEPGEDDLPEVLEGDEIDIGEVVAEHLGLHLDPYPRRPGVVFSARDVVAQDDEGDKSPGRTTPFAVLRDLKPN